MGDTIDVQIKHLSIHDEIATRQKKERKELQAKIQALKKTAGKGDKRKKKEVLDEICKLEIELENRHTNELNTVIPTTTTIDDAVNENVDGSAQLVAIADAEANGQQRVSKAQKRRDKKAKEEREKQVEILAQEEINKTGPRTMETKALRSLLKARHMTLFPIASDGDCLYNAIRHQLTVTGRPTIDTPTLRQLTATYISDNKDSLIFYMTNPATGDCLTGAEFDRYCEAIRSTPAWGGQIEIKALSNVLRVPIEVLQAVGPPTVQCDQGFAGANLVITYHRLMYSLGEHYNSTRPIVAGIDDSSDDDGDEIKSAGVVGSGGAQ